MDKPRFPDSFWDDLAQACPHGRCSVEVVRSWFDMVWPRFQTYRYTKRGMRRAVASWWSRVRPHELEAARARIEIEVKRADDERLRELAALANAEPPAPEPARPARRFRVVGGGRG